MWGHKFVETRKVPSVGLETCVDVLRVHEKIRSRLNIAVVYKLSGVVEERTRFVVAVLRRQRRVLLSVKRMLGRDVFSVNKAVFKAVLHVSR